MTVEEQFRQVVKMMAETGGPLLVVPPGLDPRVAGNIMADLAGHYIDGGQAIKAMIIIAERKRLGI